MDFITTDSGGVPITIDGTAYTLARFTGEDWEKREAEQRRATLDEATKGMTIDQRARFLSYFQMPPTDCVTLLQWALSPEGSRYVVLKQLLSAGVPKDTAEKLAKAAPLRKLRWLSEQLTDALENITAEQADATRENDAGPLAARTGESADSPSTASTTAADSPTPTPASTPAS